MKKTNTFLIILSLFSLCNCNNKSSIEDKLIKRASEHLNISLENTTYLEGFDNHGGFYGDGETFVKVKCYDSFESNFDSSWEVLPLKGDAYKYFYEWGGVLLHPETNDKLIPEIQNGFWNYKNTGPMNWDLAIYDIDENILYFYEWDA